MTRSRGAEKASGNGYYQHFTGVFE